VPLGAIGELRWEIKTSSELVQGAIVTVWRLIAKRRLVDTGNPSACATVDCNFCGIAIALHVCN
jgi:hypothetical protein